MIKVATVFFSFLLLPYGNAQKTDGPDPSIYPLTWLEEQLFGSTDKPISYASFPSCNGTYTELENGRRDKPWNIPSNFYENLTVKKSATVMHISIIPNRLMQVDSRSQSLTIVAQIIASWVDCRLAFRRLPLPTWIRSRNLTLPSSIGVPAYAIMWKPQIILEENFDSPLSFEDAITTVTSLGKVRVFLPQKVVTVTCKLQLASYPFDTQNCSFSFRSTTYDTRYLGVKGDKELLNYEVDPEMSSNMWELINLTWHETNEHDTPGQPPFCRVQVFLTVRRLPLFHLFNLVLPNTLLLILCCAVFALPASDCGTEINMAVTILLAIVVFMLILYDQLPQTGDEVALLSLYFAACMVLVSLSCLCSICTTLIDDMSTVESVRQVPRCLHVFGFHYVGPVIIPYAFKNLQKKYEEMLENENNENNENNNEEQMQNLNDKDGKSKAKDSCCCAFLHMKDVSQWKTLAEVADRIFFILFLLSTITCITAFLVSGYSAYHRFSKLD